MTLPDDLAQRSTGPATEWGVYLPGECAQCDPPRLATANNEDDARDKAVRWRGLVVQRAVIREPWALEAEPS